MAEHVWRADPSNGQGHEICIVCQQTRGAYATAACPRTRDWPHQRNRKRSRAYRIQVDACYTHTDDPPVQRQTCPFANLYESTCDHPSIEGAPDLYVERNNVPPGCPLRGCLTLVSGPVADKMLPERQHFGRKDGL